MISYNDPIRQKKRAAYPYIRLQGLDCAFDSIKELFRTYPNAEFFSMPVPSGYRSMTGFFIMIPPFGDSPEDRSISIRASSNRQTGALLSQRRQLPRERSPELLFVRRPRVSR